VKQRYTIQHEAHALANALLGGRKLPRLVETRQFWAEEGTSLEEPVEAAEEEPPT
jgi:hypothetical protein